MEITKVFNNNALLVRDSENVEAVVMGKGIGFKKKRGDTLIGDDIEKTYDRSIENFIRLYQNRGSWF